MEPLSSILGLLAEEDGEVASIDHISSFFVIFITDSSVIPYDSLRLPPWEKFVTCIIIFLEQLDVQV